MANNQRAQMNSSDDNRRSALWYSTTYIDEYFRLLGGFGCFRGYCDYHVPAHVTLSMDEWVGNLPIPYEHAVKDLIDHQMCTHTDQLQQKRLNVSPNISLRQKISNGSPLT